ncbi:MAG: molecular chaperone HtpG [Eggerthellaceae bacterium]|jgi:molecular chaperone HtpG
MRKFKTESKKLLDLMINSIYTNREIFLRELISNASDADDKLYFKSLTDHSIELGKNELHIRVSYDKDARTITVSDNGIGMTADELEKNLGTIAHSDSQEFKQAESEAEKNGDVDIIGQFGVGFYSSFMVASKVTVLTRPYNSEQAYKWESDGIEGYTISEAEKPDRGTDIILTVKEGSAEDGYDDFLDETCLKMLIKRYSNYVHYPILMDVTVHRPLPKPEDAGDDYQVQYEDVVETQTINSMTPIWKKRKSEVKDEEYNEFYKSQFHDYADPQRVISFHAEGAISYDVLLFIPSHAQYDLYSRDFKKGLQLYSSNVLIMDKCEDLLPDCFNFVVGVVDSQDLHLNISRETLQQNRELRAVANRIEKKIKQELVKMRDKERDEYEKFWDNFGRSLKYGLYMSYGMRKDLLADLLMFYSAKQQKMVTLDDYLADAGEDCKGIFYAMGDSVDRLGKMPLVQGVLDRGYDVLLCKDEMDEFCFQSIGDYQEKQFKNVAGGDLGLDSESDKAAADAAAEANKDLLDAMKEALGDKVTKVTVSTRLGNAAAAVTAEGYVSLEMERVMANMPGADQSLKSERVLEVNPDHEVFATLKAAQALGDTEKVENYTKILYDQALLVEGLPIDDPSDYAKRVVKLMN